MFSIAQKLLKKVIRCSPGMSMSSHCRGLPGNHDHYVWIDLEMTGLDEKIHKIVEVACIITNHKLDALDDGIHLIVHQSMEVFDQSDEWPKKHHAKTGLMEESLKSNISIEEADKLVAEYIKRYTDCGNAKGTNYLAGNSVYMDKRFLEKYMVNVDKLLHYRLIDISTIKILCSHWHPSVVYEKKLEHRALSDIKESIDELKFYRKHFFINQSLE